METSWISAAAAPRKLICVCGVAVSVPGSGDTSTATPASLALWSVLLGRHEGALALEAAEACLPEPQPAAATVTITASAHPAARRRRASARVVEGMCLILRTVRSCCALGLSGPR